MRGDLTATSQIHLCGLFCHCDASRYGRPAVGLPFEQLRVQGRPLTGLPGGVTVAVRGRGVKAAALQLPFSVLRLPSAITTEGMLSAHELCCGEWLSLEPR